MAFKAPICQHARPTSGYPESKMPIMNVDNQCTEGRTDRPLVTERTCLGFERNNQTNRPFDRSSSRLRGTYSPPTLTGAGQQQTVSTNTGCNQWLSLVETLLKVALVGRHRSLVANTSKCGWAINPPPFRGIHRIYLESINKQIKTNQKIMLWHIVNRLDLGTLGTSPTICP